MGEMSLWSKNEVRWIKLVYRRGWMEKEGVFPLGRIRLSIFLEKMRKTDEGVHLGI